MVGFIFIGIVIWRLVLVFSPGLRFREVINRVVDFIESEEFESLLSDLKATLKRPKVQYLLIAIVTIPILLSIGVAFNDYIKEQRKQERIERRRQEQALLRSQTNATIIETIWFRSARNMSEGSKLEKLYPRTRVKVIDNCDVLIQGVRWCRIRYKGKVGYCSGRSKYLRHD